MSLNTVTVTGHFEDAAQQSATGFVTFTPSAVLTDATDDRVIAPIARSYTLVGGAFTSDPLVATDNTNLSPSNWVYTVEVVIDNQAPYSFTCFIPHTPSPVDITALTLTGLPQYNSPYLLESGGTMTGELILDGSPTSLVVSNGLQIPTAAAAGDVLTSDGSGNATWQPAIQVSPAAWWQLADTVGSSTAADSSGNDQPGAATDVTFGVTGPSQFTTTAASFAGATGPSGILTTFNPTGFTAITLEAWVNLDGQAQTGNPRLLTNSHTDSGSDLSGFELQLASGNTPRINMGNGTTQVQVTASSVTNNAWHYVAATWNGTTISLYVDGILKSTGALSGTLAKGKSSGVSIGYDADYNGDYFTGYMAQVMISAVALSADQIQARYAGTLPVPQPSIVPAWGSALSTWTPILPSGDQTGATDLANIQAALNAAQSGQNVYLAAGNFYTNAPIVFPARTGVSLCGQEGAMQGGSGSPGIGTIIKPVAAFASSFYTNGNSVNIIAVIILGQAGRHNVQDLWINGSLLPSSCECDGINSYSSNGGHTLYRLGINTMPGWGVFSRNVSGTGGSGLGFYADTLIIQGCGEYPQTSEEINGGGGGYHCGNTDCYHANVHAQNNYGTQISIGSGDNRLVACRADGDGVTGSTAGYWLTGYNGSGGIGLGVIMIGCSTGGNNTYAVNCNGGGDGVYGPYQMIGCSFNGDGANGGGLPAIQCTGRIDVNIIGCSISTDATGTYPNYCLQTINNSGSNEPPDFIGVTGGMWQAGIAFLDLTNPPKQLVIDGSLAGFIGEQAGGGTSGNTQFGQVGPTVGVDWYNVKAYGATGNGTTNDSAAIAAAYSAAKTNAGAVFFPQGTYLITSTVAGQVGVPAIYHGAQIVTSGAGVQWQPWQMSALTTPQWINVKDFGATGNGTDDTAAIQAALTFAGVGRGGVTDFATGATVYFPLGTYVISAPLIVNTANISLIGDGPATTIRVSTGFSGSQNGISAAIFFNQGLCKLERMTVAGQSNVVTANAACNGIEVLGAGCVIRDVTINGINGWAYECLNETSTGGQRDNTQQLLEHVGGGGNAGGIHFWSPISGTIGSTIINSGISGGIASTTVASGSNGGEISQIATWSSPSAGVLDVASVPSNYYTGGGTLYVAASGSTTATITYTGISGNSFTGCAYVSGSATGTIATGNSVAAPNCNLDAMFLESAEDMMVTGLGGGVSNGSGAVIHCQGCAPGVFDHMDIATSNSSIGGPCILLEDYPGGGHCQGLIFSNLKIVGGAPDISIQGGTDDIIFANCKFDGAYQDGVVVNTTGNNISFDNCEFGVAAGASGSGEVGSTNCDISWTGSGTGYLRNCTFGSGIVAGGQSGVQNVLNLPGSGLILVTGCNFTGSGSTTSNIFTSGSTNYLVRNCYGYNPFGTTSVSVPASGTATTALAYDAVFYVTANAAGTTTAQVSGGPVIPIAAGTTTAVTVPAGQTIKTTYTSGDAPTWVVQGL